MKMYEIVVKAVVSSIAHYMYNCSAPNIDL